MWRKIPNKEEQRELEEVPLRSKAFLIYFFLLYGKNQIKLYSLEENVKQKKKGALYIP